MRDRIKTLVIDANGYGWKAVALDSTLYGLLGIKKLPTLPISLRQNRFLLVRKIAGQFGQRYEALSYIMDWKEALSGAPELDVEICNMNNLFSYFKHLRNIARYELIIILHSAAGDSMSLLLKTSAWFNQRKAKIVIFIGNEYALLEEKIRFIQFVKADYICSQLPLEAAQWLYAEAGQSRVLSMPHALNPKLYSPDRIRRRPIDIGFIGALYDRLIGDRERTNLIQYFQENGSTLGLHYDIRTLNIPRSEWAKFLKSCKGVIGAESGTYFLDKKALAIAQARTYLKAHPKATFEEVFERCFKGKAKIISGKAISSRHFDPIGTLTCQLLIEGYYNGILLADEHYISIKKDLSNIRDVLQRFKDEKYREIMVQKTYDYVMAGHTYQHRIESLLRDIGY